LPCYHPLQGYRALGKNPSGKRSIVFSLPYVGAPVQELACGQCIGCRLERSRQWAIRCVHEASQHEDNCFITLTYAPACLPANASLVLKDFQDFFKRFRKQFVWNKIGPLEQFKVRQIRFFHCGEYGEKYERPHYHAVIFGFDFPDKVEFHPWDAKRAKRLRDAGMKVYWSEYLARLWPFGTHEIGTVTFESAAYVARYITKKVTGENAAGWYGDRRPEYTTMSRRPGIGAAWFKKFHDDVFPSDEVVMRGFKLKAPRFYGSLYELTNPAEFADIKRRRKSEARLRRDDNTPERLEVKENVKLAQFSQLKRSLEDG